MNEPKESGETSVVKIPVQRVGDTSKVSVVRVHTKDGSASSGEDYHPISEGRLMLLSNFISTVRIWYLLEIIFVKSFIFGRNCVQRGWHRALRGGGDFIWRCQRNEGGVHCAPEAWREHGGRNKGEKRAKSEYNWTVKSVTTWLTTTLQHSCMLFSNNILLMAVSCLSTDEQSHNLYRGDQQHGRCNLPLCAQSGFPAAVRWHRQDQRLPACGWIPCHLCDRM